MTVVDTEAEFETNLSGEGKRIAIVVAEFNEMVTNGLLRGAKARLCALGVQKKDISIAKVPGAFEIPGVARRLVDTGSYDAVIALGAVIRGETSHYDAVVNGVTSGIAALSAEGKVPVLFGILTTDTVEQALNRAGLKAGNKGADVAQAAIQLANLYKMIK